ncbi:amino acid ABC transporter permease [Antrihabitans sp. YC2-6]|uniref:amino acid ABC transporter permease n=1 Tax=Antrihabitans sp. YC2-6 TaxID=2799498 RepID=UPI0018F65F03|nr:amino acid ABC transporter permease [Antrihabitans sp. YC2-6]MBJ8345013.1 amino acid ABC transporter permease [Antrihabitans sp. YC2-6]
MTRRPAWLTRSSAPKSVLFDIPGPRARRVNFTLSVVGVLLVLAVIAWIVMRLDDADQLTAAKWEPFTYTDIQNALIKGMWATIKAAAVGTVFALALGAILAAGRLSDHAPVRWVATTIIELFRALPLLLLIFFAFYLGKGSISPFMSVVIGLTLYNGSVLAEVFRAGINSLPRGQAEAAYSLGLRKSQTMRLILIPQAVRAMLPSIVAQIVVLLKDSSLGFIIAYPELLRSVQQIGAQYFNLLPAFIVGAAIYIGINLTVAGIAKILEVRTRHSKTGIRPTALDETALLDSKL